MPRRRLVPLLLGWCLLVAVGLCAMAVYELTPGAGVNFHTHWPVGTTISRASDHPTLVMFVHPCCPCSLASLTELSSLAERCHDRLRVRIVFVRPAGLDRRAHCSQLWKKAEEVSHATIVIDSNGKEAARFGVFTSGESLLYAPDGRLLFCGGLTPARGHAGNNLGTEAVLSLIATGQVERTRTAVFGCSLQNSFGSSPEMQGE
jgi:hypothetical protein